MQRDTSDEPYAYTPKIRPSQVRDSYYWVSWVNDHDGEGKVFIAQMSGGAWVLFNGKRYRPELLRIVAPVARPEV